MALIKENDLTEGMSGKFGKKIVFRVVRGVTVTAGRSTAERVQFILPVSRSLHHPNFALLCFLLAAEFARKN